MQFVCECEKERDATEAPKLTDSIAIFCHTSHKENPLNFKKNIYQNININLEQLQPVTS